MICANCQHFTLIGPPDESPEHRAERATSTARGMGQCIGFLEAIKNYVPWNNDTCGMYRDAKKSAARDQWIAKQGAGNV